MSSMYTVDQSTPVQVATLSTMKIVGVTAGYTHTCAITDSGMLYCWGSNGTGQLGIGSTGI